MKHQAIYNLYPNVVTITGDTSFNAEGNPVTIDESLVQAEVTRLQAEYEAKEYQRKRALEYPDFKDYLDGIVKGDQAQVQAYIDACNAVKNKYPKGQV
jgi:tRNA A37 N6-isopentenylltransferase MiaA